MDKFEGIKQQVEKELSDDSKPWTKYLKLAEEKSGVNRSYIFIGKQKSFDSINLLRLHLSPRLQM